MIDPLLDYLKGAEWQEYVAAFVDANCEKFEVVTDDFTHEQYAAWKNFQEIAEQILDAAMSEVGGADFGGGLKKLEAELDRISSLPASGPRDSKMKEILGQLLSFDSFPTFAYMMSQAYQEKIGQFSESQGGDGHVGMSRTDEIDQSFWRGSDPTQHMSNTGVDQDQPKYLNELIAMGFSEDLSRLVLESSEPETPLHDLVAALSDMQEGMKPSSSSKQPASVFSRYQAADIDGNGDLSSYGLDFSHDYPEGDFAPDGDEFEGSDDFGDEAYLTAFADVLRIDETDLSAKSALASSICESIKNGALVQENINLFRWANGMKKLISEVETCVLFHKLQGVAPSDINFEEWHVNPFGTASSSDTSVSLVQWYWSLEDGRKYAEDKGLMGELCSEKELARMAELKRIADMGSDDERLLHTLLSRNEETQRELEVHHRSFDLLTSVDGGLSREKLEEMYLFLKENVVSGDPIEVVSEKVYRMMQEIDPSGQNGSAVSLLLDMHLLEDEQLTLKTRINAILHDDVPLMDDSVVASLGSPLTSPFKKSSHSPDAKRHLDYSGDQDADVKFDVAESKSERDGDLKGEKYVEDENDKREADAAAKCLNKLKEEHRAGLAKLKTVLQEEKAWKLGEMQAAMKAARTGSTNEEEERARQQEAMETLTAQLNEVEKGLISGYKQRCVAETKIVKGKLKDKRPQDEWGLSDAEREKAAKTAVKAMRDKHLAELQKLHDLHASTRSQRKDKLLEKLRRRKDKNNLDLSDADLENDANAALNQQEADATSNTLRPLLLSIAAAELMDPTEIASGLQTEGDLNDDEDEERYLDSGGDARSVKLTAQFQKWIDTSVKVADHYASASDKLIEKSLLVAVGDENTGGMCNDVLNVVIGACADHTHNTLAWGTVGHPKNGLDVERIKESIVEEYRQRQAANEADLAHSRGKSKEALERRRMRNRESKYGSKIGDDSKGGSLEGSAICGRELDDIVDSFLQEPLIVSPKKPSAKKNTKWYDDSEEGGSSVKRVITNGNAGSKWTNERERNAERKNEIKSSHEKHQNELAEDLEAQMQKRKAKMLTRLQNLQEQKNRKRDAGGDSPADVRDYVDAVAEEQRKLEHLQKSYDDIVNLVKSTSPDALKKIGLQGLTRMLDSDQEHEGNRGLNADAKSSDYDGKDAAAFAAKAAAQMRREESDLIHKEAMEVQAKKITNTFNESVQKHDISMRLERARQSQLLQNKLMQRKASASVGAGYQQQSLRNAPPGVNIQAPDKASRQMGLGHIGGSFRGR